MYATDHIRLLPVIMPCFDHAGIIRGKVYLAESLEQGLILPHDLHEPAAFIRDGAEFFCNNTVNHKNTCEPSPRTNDFPCFAGSCFFRITFLPIRLSDMLSTWSIIPPSITIELLICDAVMCDVSPILVNGPIVLPEIMQSFPMTTGPVIMELSRMNVFFPIFTAPVIVPDSRMPGLSVSIRSRMSRFASRMSSVLPVSFHQPCTHTCTVHCNRFQSASGGHP